MRLKLKFAKMKNTKVFKMLTAVWIVTVTAGLAFAFTGPTSSPGDADSSASSLVNQMAYKTVVGNFDRTTDSLEALRERLDVIEAMVSSGTTVVRGTFTMAASNAATQWVTKTATISLPGVTEISQVKRFTVLNTAIGLTAGYSYGGGIFKWASIGRMYLSDFNEVTASIYEHTTFEGGTATFDFEAEIQL